MVSDHSTVNFNICFTKPSDTKRVVTSRNLRAINDYIFSNELSECNSIIVSSKADKASVYFSQLSDLINRHAPLRQRTVTDRPSAPWLTGEIKSAKAVRRRAERKMRRTGLPDDKNTFKFLSFKFNSLILAAKKRYYESKIAVSTSSKFLLNIVKDMYGKRKESILPNNISNAEIANVFITFLALKFPIYAVN